MPRILGRPSKIWFRKYDGWWYTTIGGVRHKLAKGENNQAEAQKAFGRLLGEKPDKPLSGPSVTFGPAAKQFLRNSKGVNEPETYRWHKQLLRSFHAHVGRCLVADLKIHHVTEWLRGNS
jgi:hypothetical protein